VAVSVLIIIVIIGLGYFLTKGKKLTIVSLEVDDSAGGGLVTLDIEGYGVLENRTVWVTGKARWVGPADQYASSPVNVGMEISRHSGSLNELDVKVLLFASIWVRPWGTIAHDDYIIPYTLGGTQTSREGPIFQRVNFNLSAAVP
jgi:hypothetical protein